MQVVAIAVGMASAMESLMILQYVSLVTRVSWEKAVTNAASMELLRSRQVETRVNVAAVTLELTAVRNVMATASVNRAFVSVTAGGGGLSVKQ